jgi:hypothetical protein
VDWPTVATPTIVTTIQNAATHRLCANTHRVIVVIIARLVSLTVCRAHHF